jgi:hypothetical protein
MQEARSKRQEAREKQGLERFADIYVFLHLVSSILHLERTLKTEHGEIKEGKTRGKGQEVMVKENMSWSYLAN